jgi:hypothetical protein
MTTQPDSEIEEAWKKWKADNKYLCNTDKLSFEAGYQAAMESLEGRGKCSCCEELSSYVLCSLCGG